VGGGAATVTSGFDAPHATKMIGIANASFRMPRGYQRSA
jgi:hypothetical protein